MAQEQHVLPKASDLLELASRPARVIEHPSWTTARETALALVAAGPYLIVLLGPPGSGKTALLRNLATTLRELGRTTAFLDFDDNQPAIGRADVVLVDEADRMSAARLDELSRRGERAVVLAVLPAPGDRFRHYPGVTVVRLAPLSPDQACKFLAERLAQLGLPAGCLTEAAWARLIAHGRGVPRLLIALLGLALFVAGEDDAPQVTDAHVEQAVAVRGGDAKSDKAGLAPTKADPTELDIPEFLAVDGPTKTQADRHGETRRRRRTRMVAALVAVCLFAAAGALLTGGGHRKADQTQASQSAAPALAGKQGPSSVGAGAELALVNPPPTPVAVAPPPAATVSLGSAALALPASPPPTVAAEPSGAAAPQAVPRPPPPAAATGATPDLPPGALIHLVLIYPRDDQGAAQRGLDLARLLRSDGFGVGDPFPVAPRESKRGINYYFAQDEDAAAEIGRRLGGQYGDVRLVRLPPSAGLPRPGTIEIALGN